MSALPEPHEDNHFLAVHVTLLRSSLRHWTGRHLVEPGLSPEEAARRVFFAPFAIVSHGVGDDPIFSYGNRKALELFEMSWKELTSLPSRLSAEPIAQRERARLLAEVAARGFIDDYSGVRISRTGRRFVIESATVWNLIDEAGRFGGQAATFTQWQYS